jgi:hypothetical protein
MKRLVVPCTIVLAVLILISGCPQPQPEEPPSLAIMVESNTVEAGSSFMVSGSNLNHQQKIWVSIEYRGSDGSSVGIQFYGEPDEDGSIHPIIEVPENTIPGDYEVEIYIGKHIDDRELIAVLPIHIQARAK